jgi:hypothetical protein
MKRLVLAAALGLAAVAWTPVAQAKTFGLFTCGWCGGGCGKCCGCSLCIRQYNAFTPVCCGTVTGLGCVNPGMGYGPYGPGPYGPGGYGPECQCGCLDLHYMGQVGMLPPPVAPMNAPALAAYPAPQMPYNGVQPAGYLAPAFYPGYAAPAPMMAPPAAPAYWNR